MKLLVLDIDDTIVKTNADMIGVWKRYPDGTEKRLSTSEFAEDPDSIDGGKSSNVIFDYREFGDEEKVTNSINNGTPLIKNLRILDRCIKDGYEVAFLTARSDEEMVYRVLSNYLKTSVAGEFLPVKLNRKYCFAINDPKYAGKLGNTDAEKKARVLRYLCKEADVVKFVDDDLKNIRNAQSLNLPNLRVITAWKEATNLRKQLKENIGDSMEYALKYTLRYIRTSRSTNLDVNKLNRVDRVAKKYEAAAHSDDDSQFQVYESVKQVQELIQNFVEECNADYSVDRVRVVKSNMLLGVNITLDPFSDNPIPVSICFDPYIEEALSRDAKYLESQLY